MSAWSPWRVVLMLCAWRATAAGPLVAQAPTRSAACAHDSVRVGFDPHATSDEIRLRDGLRINGAVVWADAVSVVIRTAQDRIVGFPCETLAELVMTQRTP